jgi:hypothetical protein
MPPKGAKDGAGQPRILLGVDSRGGPMMVYSTRTNASSGAPRRMTARAAPVLDPDP